MKIIKESIRKNSNAFIQGYLRPADVETNNFKHPAIIILPGGSYNHIPMVQAESIALNYSAKGYQSFFVRYTFEQEARPLLPNPLVELANAIKMIRKNARKWNIDPNKIVISGFSIGGHITSLYNDFYDSKWLMDKVDVSDAKILKPNAVILNYPVTDLTLGFPGNKETINNWVSDQKELAAEENVTDTNAPTFIWHTADDPFVSVNNSLKYSMSLNQHNIDNELHIFHHGPHGMALANSVTAWNEASNNPHVAKWFDLSNDWLKQIL
ncbi:alpha/beta hydrolase [Apilactobacillus micheneri]|uniref:Alpha/beta hydrolase n=1 Tax=Apilactobacillus micheneri TaxID=1899430 RepID=A0ABY2YWT5_9LACO|nr:alpha/beta hydrolase [Apilactobacillus micheneri]TPR24702.1 alpha/beta hydrolase [Apilactobacillus micheneri]TPR26013.1 alpha/beta hydrolase [Apilactobacillus micheneri]TPR28203.1 alpha/beta hydrolase [Apilactobacillus micheneri]TPR29694.1 alpha/beta hydrolase [Apilactobacillus micheneri]TPR30480.1 alpha/beta hydrolase [Apilactobacillus micheneri]